MTHSSQWSTTELTVRARKREHLTNVFGPSATIEVTPDRDYKYRTIAGRKKAADIVSSRVQNIDYGNFKDSVRSDGLHDLRTILVTAPPISTLGSSRGAGIIGCQDRTSAGRTTVDSRHETRRARGDRGYLEPCRDRILRSILAVLSSPIGVCAQPRRLAVNTNSPLAELVHTSDRQLWSGYLAKRIVADYPFVLHLSSGRPDGLMDGMSWDA
jgi:hypothetical protein